MVCAHETGLADRIERVPVTVAMTRPHQELISAEILSAFELKIRTALSALDVQASALEAAPFGIGHVAVGCALGYVDFRFPRLAWRNDRRRITDWFESFMQRPSARLTVPTEA